MNYPRHKKQDQNCNNQDTPEVLLKQRFQPNFRHNGPFIDTPIIFTITALVITITKANLILDTAGEKLSGADFSLDALNTGIAGSGVVVTLGLVVFAFTT